MRRREQIMVFGLVAVWLGLSSTRALAAEVDKAKIALHGLQVRGGLEVDGASLDGLAALLGALLGEQDGLSVLHTSLVKTHYSKHAEESDPACTERACQMRTEMALHADYGLALSLMGIGQKCVFAASLYPRAGTATLRTASAQGACDMESLSTSLEQLVARLLADGRLRPLGSGATATPQAPEQDALPPPEQDMPPAPQRDEPPTPSRVMIEDGWPNFDLSLALLYAPAPMIRVTQKTGRITDEEQAKLFDQMGLRSVFEWRLFGKLLIGGQVRLLANERNVLLETGPRLGGIFPLSSSLALAVTGTAGFSLWSMREDNFFCEDVQFYGGVFAELGFGIRYQLNSWLALEADLSGMAGVFGSGNLPEDYEPYACDPPEGLTLWRLQLALGLVFGF